MDRSEIFAVAEAEGWTDETLLDLTLDYVEMVGGIDILRDYLCTRVADETMLEFCPVCGQPDNCGECTHEPMGEGR